MNPFKCNDLLESYTYPIIKIISCIVIIIIALSVSIFRDRIFPIDTILFRTIVSLFSCGILIAGILCIYISCAEMVLISEKRLKKKLLLEAKTASGRAYPMEDLISLVRERHSIELLIAADRSRTNILAVGSKSDLKPGTSVFFNKTYYIEEHEYADESDFRTALLPYRTEDQTILVLSLDGAILNE